MQQETSYVALEHKLDDVRRAHETLMVEKGDTMNRLAQALEESQAQCRNLMATNNAQQVMQLQAQVKMLNQEKEELQKNVHELQVTEEILSPISCFKHNIDCKKSIYKQDFYYEIVEQTRSG